VAQPRAKLRADVRIRPTIKGALLDMCELIGWKIIPESVALLDAGIEFSSGLGGTRESSGLRIPEANVVWPDPSASNRWIEALTSGSTPMLPVDPIPTNIAPVFGSSTK
jgi:hypothetical protein